MKGRRPSHQELTAEENERILGTLTPRAWAKLSVLALRAEFYNQDFEKAKFVKPMDRLVHEARQSSGSIRGQHRRDLVDAIQGVQDPKKGVALPDDEVVGL